FGITVIYLKAAVSGVIHLLREFQEPITHNRYPQCSFHTGIPSAKLKMLLVSLVEKHILHMRHHGAYTRFPGKVYLQIIGHAVVYRHLFNEVKQQEISAIVQVIKKAIALRKKYRSIHRPVVERAL